MTPLDDAHAYLAEPSHLFARLDSLDVFRAKIAELHQRIGQDVFYEKKDACGESVYFNYRFMTDACFPPLRNGSGSDGSGSSVDVAPDACERFVREARGIAFDAKTGRCVSRGLHKFFNVGEKAETKMEHIDLRRRHHILDKLDGSMCCAMLSSHVHEKTQYPGFSIVRFRSKMGFDTNTSTAIENFVYGSKDRRQWPRFDLAQAEQTGSDGAVFDAVRAYGKLHPFIDDAAKEGLVRLSLRWLRRDCTPIFEFCGPSNQIVIHYDQTSLVLIAIRHNVTGQYMRYDDMVAEAKRFGVPVVGA